MNHIYKIVWNSVCLCWQAVSEIAKGGRVATQSLTKTKSRIPSLTLTAKISIFFAVNVLNASIALAGPTGGAVSSGTATISTSGTTTTINQSTGKAAIDWSSFSTNSNEIVNFVQPNSSSITLNRVTGSSASTLNGQLNANGQVFIINPNGVLFGSTSQVNTAGLVASTLNLSNSDFNNNLFNFSNSSNNKVVENRGKITVSTGGTVALIAPTVKQTGTIKVPQGNVLLAAGGDITLSLSNGSLLGYTINQGKAQALINSGGIIQTDGGKVILTAKGIDELSNAVVNSVGLIQAQTVNNVRGVIELGSDLSNGTVNVSGTLDASAPNGGNGGQIKTSAAEVHVSSGTNVTTQRNSMSNLPPTTSGWELKAKNIDIDFFGGSVSSTTLGDALNKGNVTLNAIGTTEGQGNINVNDVTSWNANTALTLTASKDINFNSDLSLSGDKAKLAMNYGVGSDYNLNNGATINISGSSATLTINGSSYIVINDLGEEGDANINTLQGMNNNLTGNYALGSNIDASDTINWNNGQGFEAIGQIKVTYDGLHIIEGNPFQGSFHGLGHTIDKLTIKKPVLIGKNLGELNSTLHTPQGLFSATYNTNLRDIGLTNASIDAGVAIGALSGLHMSGNIKNVYSSGTIQGAAYIGGLIGVAGYENYSVNGDLIKDASSSARVKGLLAVGGLIGGGSIPIYNSYASGDISLPEFKMTLEEEQSLDPNYTGGFGVGGMIGIGQGIYNSHATGNILSGAYVNGNWHPELGFYGAGGLVGLLMAQENSFYHVDHSYATGNVSGLTGLGGLVGVTVYRGSDSPPRLYINNSYATGDVVATDSFQSNDIGGLVGANAPDNIIDNSYATGRVKGNIHVGGLVGNNNEGIVTNSYSTGTVEGETSVGGLVGYNIGTVENSYASGAVTGVNDVGGLVGINTYASGMVNNSYWNIETSGQSTSAGGTGKTTAELQKILTFSGWDIADASDPNSNSTWVIDEDNATPWLRYNH